MFAYVGYHGVDVGLSVAEDEDVVDVYDEICFFGWIDAIEEAIVEGGLRPVVPSCSENRIVYRSWGVHIGRWRYNIPVRDQGRKL